MDYQKIYNNLVELGRHPRSVIEWNKKTNNYTIIAYQEEHHIIPRCFFKSEGGHLDGDKDHPSNLVDLTASEHYVAHQLLLKIYPNHTGLIKAAKMMTVEGIGQDRSKNKWFEWLKIRYTESVKDKTFEEIYGSEKAREIKEKIGNSTRGKTYEERYGSKKAKEVKQKISIKNSNQLPSDKTKLKISIGNSGKKRTKEICAAISKRNKELGIKPPPCPKGRKDSQETRKKKSLASKGKPKSEKHKQNMPTKFKKGHIPWNNNTKGQYITITNGYIDKRIKKNDNIPDGFWRGRKKLKIKYKQ